MVRCRCRVVLSYIQNLPPRYYRPGLSSARTEDAGRAIDLETYNYLAVSGYSGQRIKVPCTRGREMDPNPDYDASDELEYGMSWFAWILRGVYPPPAYPPV